MTDLASNTFGVMGSLLETVLTVPPLPEPGTYEIHELAAGFEVDLNPSFIQTEDNSTVVEGKALDKYLPSANFNSHVRRGDTNDKDLLRHFRMASPTAPTEVIIVGSSDIDYEVAVVFGGDTPAVPPSNAPTGDRIVMADGTLTAFYGLTKFDLKMSGWTLDANGGVTNGLEKTVEVERVWSNPNAKGSGMPGDVIELNPASTGGDVGLVAGTFGSAGAAEASSSPTLRFGQIFAVEKTGIGTTQTFSGLVFGSDVGEYQALTRMVWGDLGLKALPNENLMYEHTILADDITPYDTSNPAVGAPDFAASTLTDHLSTNRDFVLVHLLTEVTNYPIVFNCIEGLSRGFSAKLTSNNFQESDAPCPNSVGTGRGQISATCQILVTLQKQMVSEMIVRLSKLGLAGTRENASVGAQFKMELGPGETRPYEITWKFPGGVIPPVFFGYGAVNEHRKQDLTVEIQNFRNYVGEQAYPHIQRWDAT